MTQTRRRAPVRSGSGAKKRRMRPLRTGRDDDETLIDELLLKLGLGALTGEQRARTFSIIAELIAAKLRDVAVPFEWVPPLGGHDQKGDFLRTHTMFVTGIIYKIQLLPRSERDKYGLLGLLFERIAPVVVQNADRTMPLRDFLKAT